MGITDKQKFISSLDSRHSIMFAHIYDMAVQQDKFSRAVYGDFLSENSISELLRRAALLPCEPVLFGGFEDAERKMVAFIPVFEEPFFPICAVKITSPRLNTLTHRDFLGSVLGLGIKREKCGDILIADNVCHILIHSDVASFVADSLSMVGRVGVHAQLCDLSDIVLPVKSFTEISGTVSSLRLDAVVSLFIKKGRSLGAQTISAGLVFVNGICTLKTDAHLKDGDVISVRGRGKAMLEVGGTSKKDRIFITLKEPH